MMKNYENNGTEEIDIWHGFLNGPLPRYVGMDSGLRNDLFNIKYITIHFETIVCFHKYHNIALENVRLSNNINTVFLCLETLTKVFRKR